jgi:hypothetical protein
VQKIVQDHGGKILVERTADARTVFRITIPRRSPQSAIPDQDQDEDSDLKLTPRSLAPLTNDRASENSIRHSDT